MTGSSTSLSSTPDPTLPAFDGRHVTTQDIEAAVARAHALRAAYVSAAGSRMGSAIGAAWTRGRLTVGSLMPSALQRRLLGHR